MEEIDINKEINKIEEIEKINEEDEKNTDRMRDKVYKVLDMLKIKYNSIKHERVFTEKDEDKYKIEFNSVIFKNLFLRNKNKTVYYLYCLPLRKRANLKVLADKLNEKKLCFASEEELMEKLRIKSGSVSVFNIVEVEKTDVRVILDEDIKNIDLVGFHPNDNSYTVEMNYKDIEKVLNYYDTEYIYLDSEEKDKLI